MTVYNYVVCVCQVCCIFYHCIIMDLESVNKQLFLLCLLYTLKKEGKNSSNTHTHHINK